jgi:hypothetical protein
MWRIGAAGRWSALALLALALLAAWAAQRYAPPPRCVLGAEDDIGCARGFEERERDGARGFRWSNAQALIVLRGAGYGDAPVVELALAAPRPPDAPPTRVRLAAGGLPGEALAGPAPRRYRLLARGPLAGDAVRITLQSETFTPAEGQRTLGVQVFEARVLPGRGPRWPGLLLALGLSGCGLAALALAGRRHALGLAAALGLVGGLGALWAALPLRAAPYLPALALILGAAALAWRRADLGALRRGPLLLALAGGALLDTLVVGGWVPRGLFPAALLIQAGLPLLACWGLARAPEAPTLPAALAAALAVRLLGFAARLLTASAASDVDTQLFYSYGVAALELGVPQVEYPSGALLPWMLLALPRSRELFTLLLPLLNLACDLLTVWGIWQIGRAAPEGGGQSAAPLLALFYALSPLLLPFWHAKYDPLPAALLVGGLALYARGRPGWAGAALGLGGAVKWVPWLAAPFLAWELLRGRRAGLGRLLIGLGAAVALASLPFALRDPDAFLTPYRLQGGRPLTGESVWFPLALLLRPGLLDTLQAPWSGVRGAPLGNGLLLGVQALALAGLALAQVLPAPDRRRTLALAALAPALFLLLNRVFSPQYLLIISACALAAGAALGGTPRQTLRLLAPLALMQAANQLVWPNTIGAWLACSVAVFVCGLGLLAGLAAAALRRPAAAQAPPAAALPDYPL